MTMIEFPNTNEAIEALGRAEEAVYKAEAERERQRFLAQDRMELLRMATDPKSSKNLLDKLSRSEDERVLDAVAENVNSRESTLVRLAKQGHWKAWDNPGLSTERLVSLANWPRWTDWRRHAEVAAERRLEANEEALREVTDKIIQALKDSDELVQKLQAEAESCTCRVGV